MRKCIIIPVYGLLKLSYLFRDFTPLPQVEDERRARDWLSACINPWLMNQYGCARMNRWTYARKCQNWRGALGVRRVGASVCSLFLSSGWLCRPVTRLVRWTWWWLPSHAGGAGTIAEGTPRTPPPFSQDQSLLSAIYSERTPNQ